MSYHKHCPKCHSEVTMVKYPEDSKYAHSGFSEINCTQCDWRMGLSCKKILHGKEVEPVICTGGVHPREIFL